jgi:hypothetical protein
MSPSHTIRRRAHVPLDPDETVGTPELVFTELILQILNCIYEIAIHSRTFTHKYRVVKSISFIFDEKLGCFWVFLLLRKMQEYLKT